MAKYPESKKCPRCHGTDFKRVKPEGIAFTDDRVCKNCGTRYTPPTPLWAAVLFIVIGVPIFLVGVAAICMRLARPSEDLILTLETVFIAIVAFSTGSGCVVYGLRCIRRQNDVSSTDDGSRMTEATGGG
jgi:hypothetical protein